MKRHTLLLLALITGALVGGIAHQLPGQAWLARISQDLLAPVGQIFLRLIFMIVVPLVFSALVLGVWELGKSRGLGTVAKRTLLYTVLVSTLSVLIGVTLVNLLRPGDGFVLDAAKQQLIADNAAALSKVTTQASQAKPLAQTIIDLIPKNPLASAALALEGEMLPFMIFALIFGAALSLAKPWGSESPVIIAVLEQIFAACMKVIDFAMRLAPVGVFALVFNTVFTFGFGVLKSLLFFSGVVIIGLLLQQFVVYAGLLRFVAGRSPRDFFMACRDVYLYAFSTASSNATLPEAIATAEHKLKLPPAIARFVLTVGSTANQNGTALFEGVTVLFLAQVYGVDLSLGEQVRVVIMSILAGIGTAGVPGGSLPLIMILLQSVGIPPEGIGLILGVDRFLDMCRTTINVSGDLVITALVSGRQDSALEPAQPER